MRQSTLNQDELNRRADKVFDLKIGDYVYDVTIEDDGSTVIPMHELGDDGDYVDFDYRPNMADRPQALAYLMGDRDDFND